VHSLLCTKAAHREGEERGHRRWCRSAGARGGGVGEGEGEGEGE
jgi:hypothetical protein